MAPSASAAHGADEEASRPRVTYEDLTELEQEFDDVEFEIR
jgi:hypothetical protein